MGLFIWPFMVRNLVYLSRGNRPVARVLLDIVRGIREPTDIAEILKGGTAVNIQVENRR